MTELTISAVLEAHGADLHRVRETGWQPLRCPYHEDRQASASVNLAKGGFRCHACGMSGDAIGLIMKKEGLGYRDALNFAEATLGQKLGGIRRPANEQKRRPSRWRDRLFA